MTPWWDEPEAAAALPDLTNVSEHDRHEVLGFAAFLRHAGPYREAGEKVQLHPEWHAWATGKGPTPDPDSAVGPPYSAPTAPYTDCGGLPELCGGTCNGCIERNAEPVQDPDACPTCSERGYGLTGCTDVWHRTCTYCGALDDEPCRHPDGEEGCA